MSGRKSALVGSMGSGGTGRLSPCRYPRMAVIVDGPTTPFTSASGTQSATWMLVMNAGFTFSTEGSFLSGNGSRARSIVVP